MLQIDIPWAHRLWKQIIFETEVLGYMFAVTYDWIHIRDWRKWSVTSMVMKKQYLEVSLCMISDVNGDGEKSKFF